MYKKIFPIILILILGLMMSSCSKKIPGTVGEAIDITIDKSTSDIGKFLWAFKKKPADSKLDPRDFLPSDDSEAVSFIPDVAGEYEIIVAMIDGDGKESNETFVYEVVASETPVAEKPVESPKEDINVAEVQKDTVKAELKEEPKKTRRKIQRTPPKDTAAEDTKSWKKAPKATSTAKKAYRPVTKKTNRYATDVANQIPKKKDQFTIQISSFRTYEKAQMEVEELKKAGFDANIQRAYFKSADEIWYRVRIGNFTDKAEARKHMNDIKAKTKKDCWIDNVREDG